MSQENVNKVRVWLSEQDSDVLLVTQAQNRSYLSGWLCDDTEGAGVLLVSQQQQIVLINPVYAEVAQREAVGWEVIVHEGREYAPPVVAQVQKHGWQRIGFESSAVTYADYEKLRIAGENMYTLHPFEQSYVSTLRLVKQPYELELLKRAVAITDEAFAYICHWIEPGVTEKELEWEIVRQMVERGADGPAFDTIVASGPNGSMPHARSGARRIQRGELITIDMGARYKGYCADMTRTICLGEPAEPRMREVYDAVLHAMKTCEAGLHAGMSGPAAHALARDALDMANLSQYFVHSTGHGVGLQIHEEPSLSPRAPEDVTLPAGCVVTVEPGVYIPESIGVRVEDCVLVKEDGVEVLTQSPTELVIQR
jgi:Xaa-Pro aminopeptidase